MEEGLQMSHPFPGPPGLIFPRTTIPKEEALMQRRTKPLSPALPPLTPTPPAPLSRQVTKLAVINNDNCERLEREIAGLKIDLFTVRKLLRAERINNAKRENALAKYNGILENVITSQREAFEQLHAELVPNVLRKGVR
jgi:hypothetical protein